MFSIFAVIVTFDIEKIHNGKEKKLIGRDVLIALYIIFTAFKYYTIINVSKYIHFPISPCIERKKNLIKIENLCFILSIFWERKKIIIIKEFINKQNKSTINFF